MCGAPFCIDVDSSGLSFGDVAMRLSGDIRPYFCWPGVSNKYLKVTEAESPKVSLHHTLWPMCCSLSMGVSWSLYFAQTANMARLNRQSSPLHSVEMTDRGSSPVLGTCGQNAQTDHHLHVDNTGNVSDCVSQAHLAVDESKKEFEKDRLTHHEIAVSADAGRALELNVEQLRTLRTVERFGQIRKGLRCSLTWVRVAGGELDALTGHVTFMGFLRRETLSPFHCVYRFARRLHHRRGPHWARARAELVAFTGVVVFIEAGWARPWMAGVLASDASPCGFGVAQSFLGHLGRGYCESGARSAEVEVRGRACGSSRF